MQKRFEQAFLDGYKPSIIVLQTNQYFDQLKDFPHIHPFDRHPESYIFFQNEQLKKEYAAKKEGIDAFTYEDHILLGLTLGFPRRSVEWFAKMRRIEDETGEFPQEDTIFGIGISWAGFYFGTHLDLAAREIAWLWQTYTSPLAAGNPIYIWDRESPSVEVPFGNFSRVQEVLDSIREKRSVKASIA